MTCKECIHYEACKYLIEEQNRMIKTLNMGFALKGNKQVPTLEFPMDDNDGVRICRNQAHRDKYIELPCKVGDKVAVRALCECVITTADYEECRNICPFEDDCECEECDTCNEKIFDTKVSAIYNNGYGWCIEFEHFIIQARFTDIGKSFFIGENAHEQAVAYNKALAERRGNK